MMISIYTSSQGYREFHPKEMAEYQFAIELTSTMMTRVYFGKGGRHPILKKKVHDWCKENTIDQWYCEYIKTSLTTGYSVIKFKSKLDATLFRLFF